MTINYEVLPPEIKLAIRSGKVPPMRDWRSVDTSTLTRAERVMMFIERYCVVPEGRLVGLPMKLAFFQEVFIYSVYDSVVPVRTAILSIARKNGKTGFIAALLVAHAAGPEALQNSQIISGAMSRAQAALVYGLASKMILMSPKLRALVKVTPSGSNITGLRKFVSYKALSAEATTAHGLSPALAILDEVGQVKGPNSPFVDAILTSQGAHEHPLTVIISTQAPSDADLLSTLIDDAERSKDESIVCHVYEHNPLWALTDETKWIYSNPAIGIFRSVEDVRDQANKASRMPSVEARTRNLTFNQRVALESLFIAPSIWYENGKDPVDESAFFNYPVHLGLDLSMKTDLTAAVIACKDDRGILHLKTFCFAPSNGVEQREMRDKAPYQQWAREGKLFLTPGSTVEYEWVCEFLALRLQDMELMSLQFDRWRMEVFQEAAKRTAFYDKVPVWKLVGQGYHDMNPRIESFEGLLLSNRLRHGNNPLLNMAASQAIVASDPANNRKLAKNKSTQRIDPLVAALMAVYPLTDGQKEEFDIAAMVG